MLAAFTAFTGSSSREQLARFEKRSTENGSSQGQNLALAVDSGLGCRICAGADRISVEQRASGERVVI